MQNLSNPSFQECHIIPTAKKPWHQGWRLQGQAICPKRKLPGPLGCHRLPLATISEGRLWWGPKQVENQHCPKKIEERLVDEAFDAADKAFGISRVQLMMRAGRIAKEAKTKTSFKNDIPGKDWWLGLKKLHPRLVLCKPEGTASSRLKGLDVEKVGRYFAALVTFFQELLPH